MDPKIIEVKICALNAEIARLEESIFELKTLNDRLTADNKKLQAELTAALQIIDSRSVAAEPAELRDLREYTKRLNQDLLETRERAETTCKRLLLMVSELAEISAGGML